MGVRAGGCWSGIHGPLWRRAGGIGSSLVENGPLLAGSSMSRDSRYDILFEPVRIGPVTARNRFYQVQHCNGMGYRDVSALAAMRGMKAEGGWGVVCTEMVEIHHGSDVAPYIELRNWDENDIPTLACIAEKIHEHKSLAGIELCHSGYTAANLYSRETPM